MKDKDTTLRNLGIDIISKVPWGTHLCQFYQTKEDCIDILVPYFKAGLENNEFCMWITSEPLKSEDAKKALNKVVKDLDSYIKKGQLEILDASQWYTRSGRFDSDEVLQGWIEKENQAIKNGFDGLRLTGSTFWLEKKDWDDFVEYEEVINTAIKKHRMIATCSYSLDKCRASEIIDVISNHKFALIRRDEKWECIESTEHRKMEELNEQLRQDIKERKQMQKTLEQSEKQLQSLSAQLLASQESERKRIALDLHDSVSQILAALKYRVENVLNQLDEKIDDKTFHLIKSLIPQIQESIIEIDRIGRGLRPSMLDDLGVLSALSWFCREFTLTYPNIKIEQQIAIEEDEVPEPLKVIIYRVLQESFNNIAKHSGANLVTISLNKLDATIEFSIRDNGRGFNVTHTLSPESHKGGWGLNSMIKRTENSGGSLLIKSDKDTGTTIQATWTESGTPLRF